MTWKSVQNVGGFLPQLLSCENCGTCFNDTATKAGWPFAPRCLRIDLLLPSNHPAVVKSMQKQRNLRKNMKCLGYSSLNLCVDVWVHHYTTVLWGHYQKQQNGSTVIASGLRTTRWPSCFKLFAMLFPHNCLVIATVCSLLLQVNVKTVNKRRLFAKKYPAAASQVTTFREAEAGFVS